MKANLYQTVTDEIVRHLEQGVRPWVKPWSAVNMQGRVTLPVRHSGIPYRGINVLNLWMAAIAKGYQTPRWMTFKQALDLGGAVRKGEKGTLTVYADSIVRQDKDEATGEDSSTEIHFLKGYTVFNVEQIDGLPAEYHPAPAPVQSAAQRIEQAEAFFKGTGADIRHGGARAYYAQATDLIQMPPFEAFREPDDYYATLAHEATHWTKHATRLGRDFGRKRWGDEGYAMEELVAELGSAFLCAALNIKLEARADHASYIASWLKVLKNDKSAVFAAAAHAQRAADFLNSLSTKFQPES